MAFCSQCGANNADGAKFCGGCGAALPQQGAPTWQPAPGAQTAQQGAPTAQPPWADPSWQQAAPTGQPTWQSAPGAQAPQQNIPTGQPMWQAAPGAPTAGQGRPGMTQVKEPRGWIGVIGAVVVLISMFFLSTLSIPDYGVKATFFDLFFGDYSELIDGGTMVFAIAAIALMIVGAVLYLMSKNQIGRIISIIGTVTYFIAAFGTDPSAWGDGMEFVGMGFWVGLIGYIVMILSMTLKSANASIDAAFGGGKR